MVTATFALSSKLLKTNNPIAHPLHKASRYARKPPHDPRLEPETPDTFGL
jgi:hypothetical protein